MASESSSLKDKLPRQKVRVLNFGIPKFNISSTFEAFNVLKELRVVSPFSLDADFTKMLEFPSTAVYAESMFHKASIEVNEEGTEATAINILFMKKLCRTRCTGIDFVADHPFLFLIREDLTGTILFMGQVLHPDGADSSAKAESTMVKKAIKIVWSTESRDYVMWCHGRFTKSREEFYVANVYAPCDDGAKQGLWDSLSARIQSLGRRRVCVCGDFNVVKHVDERRTSRGGPRSLDHIPFNLFIDDNNLIDLPLSGRKFTWFKGDGLSMSRLDRFLLSEEWCLAWPNCKQTARLRGLSDHCSLVLFANEEDWGPRPSRMLKCWRDIPGYQVFVKDRWKSIQVDGWGGYVLKEKLRMIKAALKDWHTTHAQNLPSRIESLKVRLSTLDQKGGEEVLSEAEIAELHGISTDIHSLSRMNASISWQQSRSLWLKEGDANSKYFHSVLAGRRRGNSISMLQADGVTLEGVNPIRQVVFSHFASHFKGTHIERPGVENLQFKRLKQLESSSLIKSFSEAEVKAAVWECDSYKSPGPEWVNFGFIKDFWVELRGDVMRFISEFHRNGKLTKDLNSTFIALIPKIDSPQRLNDFRPISLVGSLYKILDKVLANRLRLVIGSVVSVSQTAFVKDMQILDVDWGYLDEVMGRMSFPGLWRKWIKECVCTATASILVNGSPTDEFPLERGLRQGDPLSPFLFLLAAEGLNVLMEAAVARNLFTRYSIDERDPVTVNFHKSMLVGVNIPDSWLGEAASALCCKVGKIPFFYLGLPIGGDSRRLSFWEPVLDRLKNRLSGWKNRFLSFGGRLVLLKSVLSSLPIYVISFFKAPSECRGLGVRQVREFNLALLGKWCWRMLVDKEGLWFRMLAARYKVERGRLRDGGRRRSSWWREIACIREGGELGDSWFGENVSKKEWRRPLWAWEEEMLMECQALLLNLSLQALSSDRWQWQPDPVGGYTVPLKVSIFTWRLLRDRLPTKTNLVTRGILSSAAHFCVTGCGEAESAHHLVISCSTSGSLWTLVCSWIGITPVHSTSIRDHFVQFTCLAGGSRARRFFLQLSLFVCGLCGRKEITDYFEAQQAVLFSCSTRSSYSPLGG
ncbi:hypothetical protein TSUD_37330 [Trifolium subterraneum]|uniref:Reverse transcriptase domain-containing protein n=1 Tax=Trifolium subterraneum TaxID=3900 RepID=A0A2Z6LIJ7_TRISU|nr:hypothetical protein TSUD_37330 [Trifolium subterraneum]